MVKQRRLSDRFAFAQQLQGVATETDLLSVTLSEIQRTTGYHRCWLYLLTPDKAAFELIDLAGQVPSEFSEHCLILPVAGDRMLEEIALAREPVVVVDARTDPRTDKEMTAKTGSVTLISIPVRLPDYPLGGLGTGTFEHEGPRPPSDDELQTLVDIADQVAIALARIRSQAQRHSAQRERDKLLSHLAQLKRQESTLILASGLVQERSRLLDAALDCLAQLEEQGPPINFDNLRAILNQMHALSRPLSKFGKRVLGESIRVDLSQRLGEIFPLVSNLLPSEIEVEFHGSTELPEVLADVALIDEVLLELILAAKEAVPAPGKLSISTRAQGEWVDLELLYRGARPSSGPENSLEWALCEHIVSQHSGKLEWRTRQDGFVCLARFPAADGP